MSQIDIKQIEKIAKLSSLYLNKEEAELFAKQLDQILEYTSQIKQANGSGNGVPSELHNVLREDVTQKFDSTPIIQNAPQAEENLFIVPKVV